MATSNDSSVPTTKDEDLDTHSLNEPFRGSVVELERRLKTEADRLGIDIPQQVWQGVCNYCTQLWDWNAKVNLTRHLSPESFVQRDLLDSFQVAKLIETNEKILDVGTGGGVPGVLVGILRPDLNVSLCDSVGKKARVVEQIIRAVDLPVAVHPVSVQRCLEKDRFDSLTSRAVGPMAKLLVWLAPHWNSFQRMLAIKGPNWPNERGEARHRGLLKNVELRCLVSYPMPGTESESSILQLRMSSTSKKKEQSV